MRVYNHNNRDVADLEDQRASECWNSKGRRCIPDVVLKNEDSMVQTRQNINKCACSKHRYMLSPTRMFMDSMRKWTYECAQY